MQDPRPKPKPIDTGLIDSLGNYEERNHHKRRFYLDLFSPGSLNTIISEQGVGKSLLAAQLTADAVNAGYSVIYVDADGASANSRVIAAGGPSPKDHPHFRVQNRPGTSNSWDSAAREILMAALHTSPPNVLVVDTVESFYPDLDHNDAVSVKTIYGQLRSLVRRGVCVVVLDHTSKGAWANRRTSQAATGSSQKASLIDTSLLLEARQAPRDSSDTIVHLYVNKDRDQLFGNNRHATMTVRNLSPSTFRVEISDWRWGSKPTAQPVSPHEVEGQLKEQILGILRTQDPDRVGLSWTNDIRGALTVGKMSQRVAARDALVASGDIERAGTGRHLNYRICDATPGSDGARG